MGASRTREQIKFSNSKGRWFLLEWLLEIKWKGECGIPPLYAVTKKLRRDKKPFRTDENLRRCTEEELMACFTDVNHSGAIM